PGSDPRTPAQNRRRLAVRFLAPGDARGRAEAGVDPTRARAKLGGHLPRQPNGALLLGLAGSSVLLARAGFTLAVLGDFSASAAGDARAAGDVRASAAASDPGRGSDTIPADARGQPLGLERQLDDRWRNCAAPERAAGARRQAGGGGSPAHRDSRPRRSA